MKLLRLPRAKVQLGLPVPWNILDEDEQLLLKKGQLVVTEHQLEALLARGAFVDVEEIKAAAQAPAPERSHKAVASNSLFDLWEQTTQTLQKLALDANNTDPAVPPESLRWPARLDEFARHVIRLVDVNPDIAIYRCLRQEQNHHFYYGYLHAIHTAVLALLLGRHLAWPPTRVLALVKAAITMNLSILDLQGQMAAQEDPIKDSQRKLIRDHPQAAMALLTRLGVTDADWLTAVAEHHEHPDGSGYPLGMQQPSELAVALRVCDVFMAKISPRVVRGPLSSQEAARQLYREDQGGTLSSALIKVFGIYPPGEFVKLASGELGLVVQRSANLRAPLVAVITDVSGKPVQRTQRRDTAEAGFAITGLATDKALLARLPPERLFGYVKVPAT